MQIAFPDGGAVFHQDLASFLTAKKVKTLFQEKGINVLEWCG